MRLVNERIQPGEKLIFDLYLRFAGHRLPIELDLATFRDGDRFSASPWAGHDFGNAHGNGIDVMAVELMHPHSGATLLGEILQLGEEEIQLFDNAGSQLVFAQDAARSLQKDMSSSAASLGRADAEEGGLGDDRCVGGVAAKTTGKGAVRTAELFVYYGLEDQIASKGEFHFTEGFEDEQICSDTALHIVGSATEEPVAVHLCAECIVMPGQGTARYGIDVTREK